jgi:hypothetical protein
MAVAAVETELLKGLLVACGSVARSGGAEEIRTPDLRRAKAALSQLSYGPSGMRTVRGHAQRGGPVQWMVGGPFWTRTRDLSLIRTAL